MFTLNAYQIPTENVHHSEIDAAANVNGSDVGLGTLYITESVVLWINTNGQGFQLDYQNIGLHAVSRDINSFPHPHLLLHYEGKLPGITNQNTFNEEEDEEDMECRQDDDDGVLVDIKFIPKNPDSLEAMYKAMSACQLLHPDPDDDCVSGDEFDDVEEGEDEEEEREMNGEGDGAYTSIYTSEGYFTGEEGFQYLTEEGRANLERMNNMLLQQRETGQEDVDLTERTGQITLSNGHHNSVDDNGDQFQDAEDMN